MKLSEKDNATILEIIKARFNQNMNRHKDFEWNTIEYRLKDNPAKLWSLNEMEKSGGEPDVVSFDPEKGEYLFFDCSAESPTARRSACYDLEAQESRKKFKPKHNACEVATAMGANLLTEEEYRKLQDLGKFDTKTSSWIETPSPIRKLGGALFADFRYDHVFVYHNGADSYYAARGFRCSLRV
ncbi:DUF4256 domain-containing protein [Arenibacter sp. TNZ]|jgi:hypothetical protein|uniref:DUF4256 domain-containing protein n=1 Tax=Arenibacter TaxID=178469 RepID=UPI000CD42E19|nr:MULTISPECIES: DUF4256 domain-containing protein [Arenibacter]MCM4171890.1 DUF4256 domain-containing protein [Arenibacter sp. TNZ]